MDGTNGFFLEFKQTGTSAKFKGIGADTSGNDNHLAVTNLAAIDQTTDILKANFTIKSFSGKGNPETNGSFKEGNCELVNGDATGESNGQNEQDIMEVLQMENWEVKLISNTMTAEQMD